MQRTTISPHRTGGIAPCMNTASEKRLVQVDLDEIQRIRDQLAKLRDYSPMIRVLWGQVAGLYQRLEKSARTETPQ